MEAVHLIIIQKAWKRLKRFLHTELEFLKQRRKARRELRHDERKIPVVRSPRATGLFVMGGLSCRNSAHMVPMFKRIMELTKAHPLVTFVKTRRPQDFAIKGLLDMNRHRDVIVELYGGKVGISVFRSNRRISQESVVMRCERLKKQGAQVCLAYYFNKSQGKKAYTAAIATIGRCGYSAVVGLRPTMMHTKRMRSYDLSDTYLFYSLGDIIDRPRRVPGVPLRTVNRNVAVLELGFDFKRGCISQETYYPINQRNFHRDMPTIALCRRKSMDPRNINTYNEIKKQMRSFHASDDGLTLRTLMRWTGAEMPKRWEHLLDYSVGTICSRTFEVAPGNVYFFRPQFHDANDKPTSELLRLRLVWRVWQKKCLFIFSYRRLPWFIPHVVVPDVNEAHIKCIAAYRRRLNAQFIAVTGSIGKTSTKDMLFNVLRQEFTTEKSAHNANVQVHIGMRVQSVKSNTQFFIQEVGGGRPGGASRHSRMVLPHIAMITNIGTAHIGNYGSQEELMRNKLGITDGLDENGVLALNYDDPLLRTARPDCRVVSYAIHNHEADFYADNVVEDNEGIHFEIVNGENRYPVQLHVHGAHNALNAAGCFAVGTELGMTPEDIVAGIQQFQTTGIRQNMVDYNGYRLLIDCYNASVESIESALTTMDAMKPEGRKVAVIGDVTGTGDSADTVNRRIAQTADSHVQDGYDQLVLFGNNAQEIRDMLGDDAAAKALVFTQREELEDWVRRNLKPGDLALFKGSSKIRLDEIIDNAFGTDYSDEKFIHSNEYGGLIKNGVKYRLFKGYGSVVGAEKSAAELAVADVISGRPITNVYDRALRRNGKVESVQIGPHIRGIQSRAFEECVALCRVTGMEELVSIGQRAFAGCTALDSFDFPRTLRFINAGAFAGCTALTELRLGENVETVGPEAFAGCTALQKVWVPAAAAVDERAFDPGVELIRF